MVTFRSNNNNRSPPFRNNNNRRPPFRSNNDNFQRKVPGRNNHNASKLIEKYNEMAREALASEDRVLSENYFQHADHFTRVQNEQESIRMARVNSVQVEVTKRIKTEEIKEISTKTEEVSIKPEVKKVIKTIEKKTAAS